jgi:hypothetical protein
MVLLTWNIVNFGFFAREFCASLELDSTVLCVFLYLGPSCIWKAFIDIQHLYIVLIYNLIISRRNTAKL